MRDKPRDHLGLTLIGITLMIGITLIDLLCSSYFDRITLFELPWCSPSSPTSALPIARRYYSSTLTSPRLTPTVLLTSGAVILSPDMVAEYYHPSGIREMENVVDFVDAIV